MESRNKNVSIGPLPGGDRRGAPGADAGRYSMQTIGGEGNGRPSAGKPEQGEPNRRYNLRPRRNSSRSTSRAGTEDHSSTGASGDRVSRLTSIEERGPSRSNWAEADHEAQSSTSSTSSLFPSLPSSPPSYLDLITKSLTFSHSSFRHSSSSLTEDVVQATTVENPVPAEVNNRVRKKWTEEMNTFILRTYFIITKLELETRAYLTELHSKFTERFPDMDVSKQRVGDQRRAIIRSKLLPTTKVSEIRAEAENHLLIHQHETPPLSSQIHRTQRMQWTTEHNESIIREYYKITQLETNRTAYRKPLHLHFIRKFPHLAHISEQRIADQRRIIIANKLIDDERINEIKQEIAKSLDTPIETSISITQQNTHQIVQPQEELNAPVWYDAINDSRILIDITDTSTPQLQSNFDISSNQSRNQELDDTFNKALEYFKDTNPSERPFIPKQKATKQLGKLVSYLNEIVLPENVNVDTSFETLQTIIYCVAWTAAKCNGSRLKLPPDLGNKFRKNTVPNWQKRLERKVQDLRKKIGRLTLYIGGNRTRTLTKQVDQIFNQYKTHTVHEEQNTDPSHYLDTLKQKLTVVSSRLRRYKACSYRKMQNAQFCSNERKFYQSLSQNSTNRFSSTTMTAENNETGANALDPGELRQFWAQIWENSAEFKEAEWIQNETARYAELVPMEYENIPIDVFQKVLNATHNWKTPGSDHLHSYWYKKLTHIHPLLFNHINTFITKPDTIPDYITVGTTYMIPKDTNDIKNPAKYRPITCLQTIYKIITACLSHLIYTHVDSNQILAEQQKGCRKFSQGCKEQLLIDSVILRQTQNTKSDLHTIYIDYKKAFDSVPHKWLIKILEIYKVHPQLVSFLSSSMGKWSTQLHAQTFNRVMEIAPIKIKRGIFQGDALSPLWFCLALNPLSNTLNSIKLGYSLSNPTDRQTDSEKYILNHLLYMDGIKIYATTEHDLERLIHITEQFSSDIAMEFGIDKCKINSLKAGQMYKHTYHMETGEIIDPLGENDTYKYLGYHQSKQIHHKETKTKLTQSFKHRLNSILKSQLYSKYTTKAINAYAIPILTYSFGVINWSSTELKNLQRLINVTMTKHRKHHPRACIQRQILPRIDGGRGIINIHNLHNRQITTLRAYFHNKSETSILHKSVVDLDQKFTPLNLQDRNKQKKEELTDKQTLISEWTLKSLHGRHRHDLSQPTVDMQASNEWLHRGELFPETEGFMVAIQDQVVETRNYQKYIIKLRNLPTDMCRRCNCSSETIQHITGACKAIAQTDYKYRHDQVANIIHQRLAAKYNLIETQPTRPTPYYKYIPDTVLENQTHKLYFDRAILTDKTIHYNRPDITLIDKTSKTALLIDIAIPNTHNLQNTIGEKLSKYVDLKNEIARMWRLEKVFIIPIVLSSTGVIPNQLFQSLTLLDLPKHTFALLQKAVILNTCRIVRKFLQGDLSSDVQTSNPISTPFVAHDVHLA